MNERVKVKNGNHYEEQFINLKNEITEKFCLYDSVNEYLDNKVSFEMNFNEIPAQNILDEIEASQINKQINIHNEKEVLELIKSSVNTMILKFSKLKKKKNFQPNSGTNNIISNTNNKQLNFEYAVTLNENNFSLPMNYNNTDMTFIIHDNFDIPEYSIIPKDEKSYYDEYKNYFISFKKNFLSDLKIDENDILIDIDKFVLLVSFENYGGKVLLSEMEFIDPIKDYKKYYPKFENGELRDYHFFSGQIVYVEGLCKNDEIYIKKIIHGMDIPNFKMNEDYVKRFYKESVPYLIHILNGPIFNKTEINFDLFIQTMNSIANENPNALILSGPFLNLDNTAISNGDIKLNPNDENSLNYHQFFDIILTKLNDIFINKKTILILCPSLLDVTNYYPLPQPPFNFSQMKNINNLEIFKKRRLKLIGNPQSFQLNEIIFGVANFDVIKDIISNSDIKGKKPTESSLEMLLTQRSYYPVLPLSSNDESEKFDKIIPIDYRKINMLSMKDNIPDIIITPSAISQFVKKINSTYFINPGTLYKGNNIGSFAKISIYPPSNYTNLNVHNRIRIDICKITDQN